MKSHKLKLKLDICPSVSIFSSSSLIFLAMNSSEKLCLQWNDFKESIKFSFRELRNDRDFSDVTLVCEDGKEIKAHKTVLASGSPVLRSLLKRHKHPNPLIYMRGVKSIILATILDFLYHGEANIAQEDLDFFLELAEDSNWKASLVVLKKTSKRCLNKTSNFPKKVSFYSVPAFKMKNQYQSWSLKPTSLLNKWSPGQRPVLVIWTNKSDPWLPKVTSLKALLTVTIWITRNNLNFYQSLSLILK